MMVTLMNAVSSEPIINVDHPGAGTKPSGRKKSGSRRQAIHGIIGVLILAGIIEIVSRAGIVDSRFLPPFSSVFVQAAMLLGDPGFLVALGATALSFLLGIAIASLLGAGLGILFGLSQTVYFAMRGVVELIRPLPPVALIPLVIIILGNGLSMKMVVVVFAAIWPILFNTMYGVHSADPAQVEMARSFGKSRATVIGRIIIPSAAPLIATGIRISSSISLVVVITVELIAGGANGLGAFIASARSSGMEVTMVCAGILMAGVLGLLVNITLAALEQRWFGWKSLTVEN